MLFVYRFINIFSLVQALLSDENKADFTHGEQITDGKLVVWESGINYIYCC